jgi:SRSO17 transposase
METTLVYQQVKEQERKIAQFLQPFFARHDALRAVLQYTTGLLSKTDRKNTWQLSEEAGLKSPYSFQHLLGRSGWDSEGLRDHLQKDGIKKKEGGILAIDETGFLKKGKQSAGVARQYSGTAGRIENCQIGVFLAYETEGQRLFVDRELYIPQAWFEDSERCKKARLPENLVFKTKPELAECMLVRAFANGIKPAWVVGDQVYGRHELRSFLEQNQCAYVLGIPSNYQVSTGLDKYQVSQLVEGVKNWQKISAGKGTKGERYYQWQRIVINTGSPDGWERWLLLRRNIKEPEKVSYYIAFGRKETSLEELAKAAGSRWIIETCFQTSKGELGLDQYEVRSYVGWYAHITLCMVSLLFLEEMKEQVNQVDQEKKRTESTMKAFLSKHGLV